METVDANCHLLRGERRGGERGEGDFAAIEKIRGKTNADRRKNLEAGRGKESFF